MDDSLTAVIDIAIREIAPSKDADDDTITKATIEVHWGLQRCLKTELNKRELLSSVLTITGNLSISWATSCRDYVSETWGGFGLTLLESLETLIRGIVRSEKLVKGTSSFWLRPSSLLAFSLVQG